MIRESIKVQVVEDETFFGKERDIVYEKDGCNNYIKVEV